MTLSFFSYFFSSGFYYLTSVNLVILFSNYLILSFYSLIISSLLFLIVFWRVSNCFANVFEKLLIVVVLSLSAFSFYTEIFLQEIFFHLFFDCFIFLIWFTTKCHLISLSFINYWRLFFFFFRFHLLIFRVYSKINNLH